jgi:hypothetical protein
MDIGQALRFVFEDEEWVKKLLLGAAILLIPIFGGLVLMGYCIAVLRNIRAGSERPLPEWTDLSSLFIDGLKLWVTMIVYMIPAWILLCPVSAVWLLPLLGGDREDVTLTLTGVAFLLSISLGCILLLYMLLVSLVGPAVYIRYAETGQIGACLRFGEVFRFTFDNLGRVIVAQLMIWALGLVIGLVVSGISTVLGVIPICGWLLMVPVALLALPVSVWLGAFMVHLYAQIAAAAQQAETAVQYP